MGSRTIILDSGNGFNGDKTIEFYMHVCTPSATISDAGIMRIFEKDTALTISLNANTTGTLANIKIQDGISLNAFSIPVFQYNAWNHMAIALNANDSTWHIYFNGDSLGAFTSHCMKGDSISMGELTQFFGAQFDDLRISNQRIPA